MKNSNHAGAGMAVAGLAAGSLLGLAAGLLYAPKSGQETRRELGNKYNEARSRMRYKTGRMKDAIKNKAGKNNSDENADHDTMAVENSEINSLDSEEPMVR